LRFQAIIITVRAQVENGLRNQIRTFGLERERIIRQRVRILGLGLATALALGAPANADQSYVVSGNDRYQVGKNDLQTSITYSGTEALSITRTDGIRRFTAHASYTRSDAAGTVPAQATFVQIMAPGGELRDRTDLDPDYLTVLNQPFAIELDASTLHDLLHLRGRLPFVFPAPMIGGNLRGYLERGNVVHLGVRPALAVDFDASGPMVGPLPDQDQMSIHGTMRMRGTAYYGVRGEPLLLALDETLTITGTLRDRSTTSPVTIVYKRSIKASDAQTPQATAESH
jgi:hypothetical protein